MAKLVTVSFAGIDQWTDPAELESIQRDYPMAEFGILCTNQWNGRRVKYIEPRLAPRFYGLHPCMHLCGRLAYDALRDDFGRFHALYGHPEGCRVQLNVAGKEAGPLPRFEGEAGFTEFIIQQQDASHAQLFEALAQASPRSLSVLIDASGGNGKSTDFEAYPYRKVGYAGGFRPGNVVERTLRLRDLPGVETFWIDMESGVRTAHRFDCGKVRAVLRALDQAQLL